MPGQFCLSNASCNAVKFSCYSSEPLMSVKTELERTLKDISVLVLHIGSL